MSGYTCGPYENEISCYLLHGTSLSVPKALPICGLLAGFCLLVLTCCWLEVFRCPVVSGPMDESRGRMCGLSSGAN